MLLQDVQEKLEYEYIKWSNFIFASSQAEYMSRAFEIAAKRAIYQKIMDILDSLDNDSLTAIYNRKDFLDYFYLKSKDANDIILTNETIKDENFKRMLKRAID